MRITAKGQIAIPQEVREKLGFFPNTEVEFEISGEKAFIEKAASPSLMNS
jgi:AbrB family looped-hinge helix DNA binding protein